MYKKWIVYSLSLCLLSVFVFGVYKIYSPKDTPTETSKITFNLDNKVTVTQIDEMIENCEDSINIVFYMDNDINSQYLFNSLLEQIRVERILKTFADLYYVDVTEIYDKTSLLLQNKYNINSIPAIVNLSYLQGDVKVNQSLVNNGSNITYDNVVKILEKINVIKTTE